MLAATRADGIDRILARDRLDAIVAPAYGDTSGPAVGLPGHLVPTGLTEDGRPGGVWLSGGFLSEPTLLASPSTSRRQSARGRVRPSPARCRPSRRMPGSADAPGSAPAAKRSDLRDSA